MVSLFHFRSCSLAQSTRSPAHAPFLSARLQLAYAKCHIDWARKNLETWEEARGEVDKIEIR